MGRRSVGLCGKMNGSMEWVAQQSSPVLKGLQGTKGCIKKIVKGQRSYKTKKPLLNQIDSIMASFCVICVDISKNSLLSKYMFPAQLQTYGIQVFII